MFNKKNEKKGFTLIESLLAISITGVLATGFITRQIENTNKINSANLINEAFSIVEAVDHRIAIDGYDPVNWKKNNWINQSEIANELILKDLTSDKLTTCLGGGWSVSLNSEEKTKLLNCNLWKGKTNKIFNINAVLTNDSAGFIQNFNLFLNFKNKNEFESNFKDLKLALNTVSASKRTGLSGSYYTSLVSNTTKMNIMTKTCISDPTDCTIQMSFDRSGGNEYLRADGKSSIIGEKTNIHRIKRTITVKM